MFNVEEIIKGLDIQPFSKEEIQRIVKKLHETDEELKKLDREIAELQVVLNIFEKGVKR